MAIYPRRYGYPRTEAERAARHRILYPDTPIPSRGAGRGYDPYYGWGQPLTEAERMARHEALYPGTSVPSRGTGMMQTQDLPPAGPFLAVALILGVGALIMVGIAATGYKYERKS